MGIEALLRQLAGGACISFPPRVQALMREERPWWTVVCGHCGSGEGLSTCTGKSSCVVRFCSRDCQQEAWKSGHKRTCGHRPQTAASVLEGMPSRPALPLSLCLPVLQELGGANADVAAACSIRIVNAIQAAERESGREAEQRTCEQFARAIPLLARSLERYPDSAHLQSTGFEALQFLTLAASDHGCDASAKRKAMALEAGLLAPALLAVRRHASAPDVAVSVCAFVQNLAAGGLVADLARKAAAIGAGALTVVLEALSSMREEGEVVEAALPALVDLAHGSNPAGFERKQTMAEAGALEAIVACLQAHPRSVKVQYSGLFAASNIIVGFESAQTRARIARATQAGVGRCAEAAKKAFPHASNLQHMAGMVLSTLTNGPAKAIYRTGALGEEQIADDLAGKGDGKINSLTPGGKIPTGVWRCPGEDVSPAASATDEAIKKSMAFDRFRRQLAGELTDDEKKVGPLPLPAEYHEEFWACVMATARGMPVGGEEGHATSVDDREDAAAAKRKEANRKKRERAKAKKAAEKAEASKCEEEGASYLY